MNEDEIYECIKQVLVDANCSQCTTELHLQVFKYINELKRITAKSFSKGVGLGSSFCTEFSKIRNLAQQLKAVGLDAAKL